ncbi:MAG: hypothetical protein KDD35_05965 [Bdellovibrionales bacterium]|nr:hypothetical protein [Bdellovibrionales bacterium]
MKSGIKNLVFFNLGLDQNYDEFKLLQRLLPARIPSSERLVLSQLDLGIYMADRSSLVLGFQNPGKDFQNWLSSFGMETGHFMELKSNPYFVQDWLMEFEEKMRGSGLSILSAQARFAGLSHLENELIEHYQLAKVEFTGVGVEFLKKVNSKLYLADLADQLAWPFPRTQKVKTNDLLKAFSNWKGSFPLLIKYNHSSGGGGNFEFLSSKDTSFLKYILRQKPLFDEGYWLIQEKLPVGLQFSCLCHSQAQPPLQSIFEVEYKESGYSYSHLTLKKELKDKYYPLLVSVAEKLADQLGEYSGPFGFDSLVTQDDRLFPIIDLNVRWNKGHLIEKAFDKFGLDRGDIFSIRHRQQGRRFSSFSQLWRCIRQELKLDNRGLTSSGDFFLPYIVSGIIDESTKPSSVSSTAPVELTYFMGTTKGEEAYRNVWKNQVEKKLTALIGRGENQYG